MTHPEATRLREQCDRLMAIRHMLIAWEARAHRTEYRDAAARFHDLEAWMLEIEDEIAAAADRLDPPPVRYTGQQWIAGLTRRVGQ